jgi:hypothetical protein
MFIAMVSKSLSMTVLTHSGAKSLCWLGAKKVYILFCAAERKEAKKFAALVLISKPWPASTVSSSYFFIFCHEI